MTPKQRKAGHLVMSLVGVLVLMSLGLSLLQRGFVDRELFALTAGFVLLTLSILPLSMVLSFVWKVKA